MTESLNTHPERNQLIAFRDGALDDRGCAAIEAHVSQCDDCLNNLEGLPEDTFSDLMRECTYTHKRVRVDQVVPQSGVEFSFSGVESPRDRPVWRLDGRYAHRRSRSQYALRDPRLAGCARFGC